ncbi:General negative regulator of transcription subunit 2 [Wickerhamiella sorbophila]|uniref:General negative regulator of transcription subunit 2 n=1 Tax=Wickerhamiella sorbophila TaxID=45607 RepID=A0A2T0FMJ1_9ASCO|nr:General negative regulator of transcription subunit 2 [Wickerhamiella sorbophila]PRT56196.1 General negative regulator of transcription subunit 2 [Wickerhamiella sorbophila]
MSVGGLSGVSLPSLPRLGQHHQQQQVPQQQQPAASQHVQMSEVPRTGVPQPVGGQAVGQGIGQPAAISAPGLGQIPPAQRAGDISGAPPTNASGAPGLQQRYQVPIPFTPRYNSFRPNMPPGPAPGVGPVQVMSGSQFNQGMPPGMPPPPMSQMAAMSQQPMPAPMQNAVHGGYPMRAPMQSAGGFSMPVPAPPPPGATNQQSAAPAGTGSSTFSPNISNSSNPLLAVLAGGSNANGTSATQNGGVESPGSGSKSKHPDGADASASSYFSSAKGHPNFELLGQLPVPSLTARAANGRESLASVLPGLGPESRIRKREGSTVAETSSTLFEGNPKSLPLLQSLGLDKHEEQTVPGSSPESPAPSRAATTMAANLAKKPDIDRYGLKPLLNVLRTENGERSHMILDTDVTHLGLSLNDPNERISRTFASPWVEASKHCVVPDFSLPECYTVHSAVPQQQKLQNLTEETLFYIFYTMPKDAMQEAAAVELTNRNWRYHKELKLWLTKDPMSDPVQQTAQAESGMYVFFDPISWEKVKKEYFLYYPDIA